MRSILLVCLVSMLIGCNTYDKSYDDPSLTPMYSHMPQQTDTSADSNAGGFTQ